MLALQGGSWQGRLSTQITLQNTCPHNGNPDSLPSVSSDLKKLFVWASHGHFRLHSTGSNWIFLLICFSAWGCAELTGTRGPGRGPGSLPRVSPWCSPPCFLPSPSPALFAPPLAGPHRPHGLRCVCCSRCPWYPHLGHYCGPRWPLLPKGLYYHTRFTRLPSRSQPIHGPQSKLRAPPAKSTN